MTETAAPCPFCGASLEHIESFAYDPPILCHEYHHPINNCWMSGWRKSFDYELDRMARWITRWNRRVVNAAPVTEATPTDVACKVHNDVASQCVVLIARAMISPVDTMIVLESITAAVLTIRFPDPILRRAAADTVAESVVERIGEMQKAAANG